MNSHWIALGTTLLAGSLPAFGSDTPPRDGLLAPVTVEERPARRVAYVEQTGHFQANPDIYDVLLRKLLDWAIPAGIWDFPDRTLIVCIYPDDPEIAFGLCDLGVGFPELGDVSLTELAAVRGPFGLPVERDRSFLATKTLSAYAREAHQAGRIIA